MGKVLLTVPSFNLSSFNSVRNHLILPKVANRQRANLVLNFPQGANTKLEQQKNKTNELRHLSSLSTSQSLSPFLEENSEKNSLQIGILLQFLKNFFKISERTTITICLQRSEFMILRSIFFRKYKRRILQL